jgi:hypothetical protein
MLTCSPRHRAILNRRGHGRQSGVVIMLLLILVVLIAGTLSVALLSSHAPKIRNERVTEDALARAKEALIAYAVSDANRPGELPCPDTNNNGRVDVGVDTSGSNCAQLVGRLPWFTLGLPDLRDGSGERYWYAVSDRFHAGGTVKLNSETVGQLRVTGIVPASDVVAVIFAPGPALSSLGQDRSTPGNQVSVTNYLEGTNATSPTDFVAATSSPTFNDRLLTISPAEIFYFVEKRAARELRPHFATYLADWGRYPYPGPWSQPATQNDFRGAAGSFEGQLPVTADVNFATWGAATISASASGGGICLVNATNGNLECTYEAAGTATPPWWCAFFPWLCPPPGPGTMPAGTEIVVSANTNNVGLMFADPPVVNQPGPMKIVATASGELNSQALVKGLDSSGTGTLAFSGRTPVSATTATVVIPKPIPSAWLTSSWITRNDWHRLAYYAISPGFAPGGSAICTVPADPCNPAATPAADQCLSICNSTTGVEILNVEVLVTMTGPEVAGQDRTSPALANYLEAGNQTTLDRVFERRVRDDGFNDQAVEIVPLP